MKSRASEASRKRARDNRLKAVCDEHIAACLLAFSDALMHGTGIVQAKYDSGLYSVRHVPFLVYDDPVKP